MNRVELKGDGFVVDATVVAEAFKLAPEAVQPLMQKGEITSKCETGVGEDLGRSRLTFHYGNRAFRLVVDQTGAILKRASFPIQARPSSDADMGSVHPNNGKQPPL